jgi:hypothetical protein
MAPAAPPNRPDGPADQETTAAAPMISAPLPLLGPLPTPNSQQRSARAMVPSGRPSAPSTAQAAWQAGDAADASEEQAHGATLGAAPPGSNRAAAATVAEERTRPRRQPDPLLPPQPRTLAPASGAIRSKPVTPPGATARPDAEPTEVHVTIGRIEITAVHEAAPPQRAAKPRRPLMSLDDYLNQRQKGR